MIENVSRLTGSALIVNLSLSVWTGRKLDKRVSEEVDQQNSTKTRAGNYHKNLLAGSSKLDDVGKVANAVRTWHYGVTQPWGDNGDRMLVMTQFMDYKSRLADYEVQFATSVNNFLNEYDTLVSAAAFQLGDLFNRDDYPMREQIVDKFGFRYAFAPLPTAGHFAVDIAEQGLQELKTHYRVCWIPESRVLCKMHGIGCMTYWSRCQSVLLMTWVRTVSRRRRYSVIRLLRMRLRCVGY
jgi:hypothetical protein